MRKVCLLLLAFGLILVMGCAEKMPQDLPPAAVQGWTALESIPEGNIRPIGEYASLFAETRDLLVFADNRDNIKLCYLNKTTGWVSVLCKDPLCSHTEEDMCPAVCDRTTASSLCYDSFSGRLYFVRRDDPLASADQRRSVIFSTNADNMDFQLKKHHQLPTGNEIKEMRTEGGMLYFSAYAMDEKGKECLLISSLNPADNTVASLFYLADITGSFQVKDGLIYYTDAGNTRLNRFNPADGSSETLIDAGTFAEFTLAGEDVLVQTNGGIDRYSPVTGQREMLFDADQAGSGDFSLAVGEDVLFFTGYTPTVTKAGRKNSSGGNIYRLTDEGSTLWYAFGEETMIEAMTICGNALLVNTAVYDEMNTRKTEFYLLHPDENGVNVRVLPRYE